MAYRNYKMRIANRGQLSKNKTYAFSMENVNNIPIMPIFDNHNVNIKIAEGCKNVLMRSMSSKNKYRYGEQGLLISLSDDSVHIEIGGEYHKVTVNDEYIRIINNRNKDDLIFIHNHPDGSTFSATDIKHLYNDKYIRGIVAVGNRHNIFVIIKKFNCDSTCIEKFIENGKRAYAMKNNISIDQISGDTLIMLESNLKEYILNNAEKFN